MSLQSATEFTNALTGMATLIGGGSASEAVQAGAVAAAENLNDTGSAVQQFFSGW
jgi:hypothetical protein